MKEKIKQIIGSNLFLKEIYIRYYQDRRKYAWYWIFWKLPGFQIKKLLRMMGIASKKYKSLRLYKDCHKGERCFLIATGPSLTVDDLACLKNEYTFGMNSLCKLFDQTGWETTYYVVQDIGAFRLLKDSIKQLRTTTFFYGDQWFKQEDIDILKCRSQIFPRYYEHHAFDQKHLKTHFSMNAYLEVYEAYTVAVAAMQLAVYMGFTEIYLLGADCNYDQESKKDSYSLNLSYGPELPNRRQFGNKMLYAYSVARKKLDKTGIKVYNATRGGMLEEFPRVSLEDVIGGKQNEDHWCHSS